MLAQEKKDRKLQMTKLEVQLTAGQKSNNELEVSVGGPWEVSVGGPWEVSVGGPWEVSVGGPWEVSVGGPWEVSVGVPLGGECVGALGR